MSIQAISNQIKSLDNEIHTVEGQIQSINTNISRKQRELASLIDRTVKEKNVTRIAGYIRDQAKKNEEITKLEKDKSVKSRSLAVNKKRKAI